MATTRTQVYLTADQRARIDLLVRQDGLTLAEVVRAALDAYLAEVQPDARTALDTTFGADPDWPAVDLNAWPGA